MKLLPFIALSALVLCNAGCRRNQTVSWNEFSTAQREHLPPATGAREWLDQLYEDQGLSNFGLGNNYAELPPQAEWPAIIAELRDEGRELKFFADVLAGDAAAAEASFREVLLAEKAGIHDWNLRELPAYLAAYSRDPAEAEKWRAEHFPKVPAPTKYTQPEKSAAMKLLAEDKIDEGIEALWKEAAAENAPDNKLAPLGRLVEIGRLTGRKELHQKALAELGKNAFKVKPEDVHGTYYFDIYLNELARNGDWDKVRKLSARFRQSRSSSEEFFVIGLIATHQLDGAKAMLAELAKAPEMGVANREDYISMLTRQSSALPNPGELVVRAWHTTGEPEKARTTLFHLLADHRGHDPYYRLVLELFPAEAPDYFEALRTYDPYQERPLIWLAELALKSGDADGAHKLIDEAIALDPSDGEQGKDTRMQVYDVLSRILRAKGDDAKADFFASVMLAIRRGEAADDFLHAGMTREAVRRYEEALGSFQDAYCLQSRLAMTLMRAGKFEEAKPHFEKAFELMPVSFGPVESHCFGCEQIFADPRVQAIARAAFSRVIADKPENPRTHYLLGMLLEETGNRKDAITSYKKAIELDPTYYNCAKRVYALLSREPARQAEANEVLALLRKISPYPTLAEHFRLRTDLVQAWQEAQNPPPSPLKLDALPLPFQPDSKAKSKFHYYRPTSSMTTDGWTTDELLRGNEFLKWLSRL
jgi:tetratricopeptide (TPR) repeat protein